MSKLISFTIASANFLYEYSTGTTESTHLDRVYFYRIRCDFLIMTGWGQGGFICKLLQIFPYFLTIFFAKMPVESVSVFFNISPFCNGAIPLLGQFILHHKPLHPWLENQPTHVIITISQMNRGNNKIETITSPGSRKWNNANVIVILFNDILIRRKLLVLGDDFIYIISYTYILHNIYTRNIHTAHV